MDRYVLLSASFPARRPVFDRFCNFPSVGVTLSTVSSPTSFSDFQTTSGADQLVVGYFQGTGASGCTRFMPTAAGVPGVQNGANVTFQMVFDGGGGKLYQVSKPNTNMPFSTFFFFDRCEGGGTNPLIDLRT